MGMVDKKARNFSDREKDILKAAFELFSEKGLHAVSIEMIAKQAEVGKGTVYKHFITKNEIYACLVITGIEETLQILKREIDPRAPVIVQLKTCARVYWDSGIANPSKFLLFQHSEHVMDLNHIKPETKELLQIKYRQITSIIENVIQRGIDEDVFIDEPTEDLFSIVKSIIFGSILRTTSKNYHEIIFGQPYNNPKCRKDIDRIYQLMEHFLIKGIMAR